MSRNLAHASTSSEEDEEDFEKRDAYCLQLQIKAEFDFAPKVAFHAVFFAFL